MGDLLPSTGPAAGGGLGAAADRGQALIQERPAACPLSGARAIPLQGVLASLAQGGPPLKCVSLLRLAVQVLRFLRVPIHYQTVGQGFCPATPPPPGAPPTTDRPAHQFVVTGLANRFSAPAAAELPPSDAAADGPAAAADAGDSAGGEEPSLAPFDLAVACQQLAVGPAVIAATRAELAGLKISELKRRARAAGVAELQLDEADDTDAPKDAVLRLVLAALARLQDRPPGHAGDGAGQVAAGWRAHPFDVLVGADGSKSVIRQQAALGFEPQRTLTLPPEAPGVPAASHQEPAGEDGGATPLRCHSHLTRPLCPPRLVLACCAALHTHTSCVHFATQQPGHADRKAQAATAGQGPRWQWRGAELPTVPAD